MPRPTTFPVALLFAYSLLIPCNVWSQEANAEKPAAKAFDGVFTKWKTSLGKIRSLANEFRLAENEELDRIRREYTAEISTAEKMVPQLRAAGLDAYKESPNVDRDLSRFLMKMAKEDLAKDRYPESMEIIKVLMENDFDDRDIFDLAGMSYFVAHDFEAAKKYMKEAKSLDAINLCSTLVEQIDEVAELWKKEAELRKAETDADDLPRVELETNKGKVVLELFENEAPDTVGNFISLVEKGFYDGLTFHRVMQGFMAQGGCPEGTGGSGPGYNIYCECHEPNHRNHWTGSLSMAKQTARNTGGSQFFLCFTPTIHLNGQHTVFGRIIEGMDVLPKIQRRTPESGEEPDTIVKATVLRKREHEYVPNKVR